MKRRPVRGSILRDIPRPGAIGGVEFRASPLKLTDPRRCARYATAGFRRLGAGTPMRGKSNNRDMNRKVTEPLSHMGPTRHPSKDSDFALRFGDTKSPLVQG